MACSSGSALQCRGHGSCSDCSKRLRMSQLLWGQTLDDPVSAAMTGATLGPFHSPPYSGAVGGAFGENGHLCGDFAGHRLRYGCIPAQFPEWSRSWNPPLATHCSALCAHRPATVSDAAEIRPDHGDHAIASLQCIGRKMWFEMSFPKPLPSLKHYRCS